MSEIVDQSLQRIAKGAGIVFLGTTIGGLLGFGSRILLARSFSQSEYGIYSLALVVLNILVMISLLGLERGSTRQIAYYRGKDDILKVQGIISSALQIALIASIFFSLAFFFTSGFISMNIFHEPGLSSPLKIISIAIPFFVLIRILSSIFRGFAEVKPTVYFRYVLRLGSFLLLLGLVILLKLSFPWAISAFSASIAGTCIAFAIYAVKKAPFSVRREAGIAVYPIGKELIFFSLPLFAEGMLDMVMGWTDTLMLGYFITSRVVGLYQGAFPLVQLIAMPLGAAIFIYVPIASGLFSRNLTAEVKKAYQVLTKWIFSVSFPVFLVLFLFPEVVLSFFFGSEYAEAALALRILSVGFIFNAFWGPNGVSLVVIGRTRTVLWVGLIAAVTNVIFNIILIPRLGIIGAAIASLLSLLAANIFCSIRLYQLSRIHPFTRNYLKPVIASSAVIFIIYFLTKSLFLVTYWMLPIILVMFGVIHALSLLLTKSFDREDIDLLLAIERRVGINLSPLKRILRRFL